MITKIKQFMSSVFERAMSYNDTNNIIVVREMTKQEIKIVLYDYVTKSIHGYMWATNYKGEYYIVERISADKGWGPFLYDTVMLMLDKPIHPSTSLTTDSFNVINNYLHNRPDVIKTLYPGKLYTSLDYNNRITNEEKYYKVLNYTYTIHNTERRQQKMAWYNESLKFEQKLVASLPNWKHIRFEQAKRWFNMQYSIAA